MTRFPDGIAPINDAVGFALAAAPTSFAIVEVAFSLLVPWGSPHMMLFLRRRRVCGLAGFIAALLFATITGRVRAESPVLYPYEPGQVLEYSGNVDSPAKFFGFELGEHFVSHAGSLRYCRYVADTTARAKLVVYGRTAEGRELVYLIIGSEHNVARTDALLAAQRTLSDPRRIGEDIETATIPAELADHPGIVWLSYNVHGNEAASTDAAMQTIYELVAGESPRTQRIRDELVVIVDPLLNPDGRDRYVNWYRSVAQLGGNPDPHSREHDEPWPGGRTNHFYFDLNRDWAWQSQIETQCRIEHYLAWQPLVHVDFHEMGAESSYFFFPPEDPINTNLTPHTLRWARAFGAANAAAFDKSGWLYYTAESFDLFYPGYGDTWPSFQGAIGMTYEQGGGSEAGLRFRLDNGSELTLRDRLHHHFVSGMATLDLAASRRVELQRSYFDYRKEACLPRSKDEVTEFVFPQGQGERLRDLLTLLTKQGIEVHTTTDEVTGVVVEDYFGDVHEDMTFTPGTVIVSVMQPAGRLAQALLEPSAEITVRKFYDISAWSLPLAMGVRAYVCKRPIPVDRVRWSLGPADTNPVQGQGSYAYLFEWDGVPAARALIALEKAGLRVRLVPERVRVEGADFRSGSLMVLSTQGSFAVHDIIEGVARSAHVRFRGVATGLTEEGIDLGSGKVVELKKPRIAVASGRGVSSLSYGAIWYLFERELDIAFSAVDLDQLSRDDWSDYDVLILPSGSGYGRAFDKQSIERLKSWVRDGGVVIAIGGAAFALTSDALALTTTSAKASKVEAGKKEDIETKTRRKTAELREQRQDRAVPGSIFRIDLDQDHVLALGLPQYVYALMDGTRSFALRGDAGDVGAFTESPAVSGYISEENQKKLRRRLFLAEERMGRGAVILFADDPNFRLFWRGLEHLFLNAVFLRATH